MRLWGRRHSHYSRCLRLVGDLRQGSCDPQMVRDRVAAASSSRRSMLHIMLDLALKAFQGFDSALRGWMQTRMLAGCAAGQRPRAPSRGGPLHVTHCCQAC